MASDQRLVGLLNEAVDPEDPELEGDWGVPVEGGGARSVLIRSWIEASRASTRVDIWLTVGLKEELIRFERGEENTGCALRSRI